MCRSILQSTHCSPHTVRIAMAQLILEHHDSHSEWFGAWFRSSLVWWSLKGECVCGICLIKNRPTSTVAGSEQPARKSECLKAIALCQDRAISGPDPPLCYNFFLSPVRSGESSTERKAAKWTAPTTKKAASRKAGNLRCFLNRNKHIIRRKETVPIRIH